VVVLVVLLAGGLATALCARQQVRFTHVDVVVDAGSRALCAWQVELVDPSGRARIVGLEGGDADPWREPPRYDPAALQGGRIVLAAFTLAGERAGAQRVARAHLAVDGDGPVAFEVRTLVAADPDGRFEGARVEVGE